MRARLLLLFAGVCFGTTGTAQALGPDSASSLTVGAVRIAIGATLLMLVALGRERGPVVAGMRAHWWIAGAGMAAYQVTFFAAVRSTGVALGTVIALGSAPALTGAAGWLLTRERPSRMWAIATSLAIIGVALLAGGSDQVNITGVLLALGAGASYAAFAVTSKELLTAGVRVEFAMAKIFTIGAILLIPVLLVGDLSWVTTWPGISMALWLGLVPTAIAYLAYASGLRSIRAHEAATLTLAEPVTATLLGALVLAERPPTIAWIGAGIIFAGLVLLAREPRLQTAH